MKSGDGRSSIIDQEARRLTHLVENVLQFLAHRAASSSRLSPEPTDISEPVRRSDRSVRADRARARVTVARGAGIDDVIAPVDESALRQTLLNLLDNAVKYGPAAQTVTVGMATACGVVRISVDDEGPGIVLAERERIWTPFYRLSATRTRPSPGSGIGLAVVRELVTQHGGRVVVRAREEWWRAQSSSSSCRGARRTQSRLLVVEDNLDLAFGLPQQPGDRRLSRCCSPMTATPGSGLALALARPIRSDHPRSDVARGSTAIACCSTLRDAGRTHAGAHPHGQG